MIRYARRHRRGRIGEVAALQGLMCAAEVVVHEVQADRVFQVLHLLGERIGQPREAAHLHPHGEVLAFGVAGGDVLGIGVAVAPAHIGPDALGGAIAALGFGCLPVDLGQHRIVDVRAECALHGLQVGLVAVRGQLHAVGEACGEIEHEGAGRVRIARADRERGDELGVGVDGRPRPHVAIPELARVFLGDVLLLGVAERPDFVALEPPTGEVPQRRVLVVQARGPGIGQEGQDRPLGRAGDTTGCPDRVALDQCPQYL